jgi:hypothetical protein
MLGTGYWVLGKTRTQERETSSGKRTNQSYFCYLFEILRNENPVQVQYNMS